jgi:hypothetical protein
VAIIFSSFIWRKLGWSAEAGGNYTITGNEWAEFWDAITFKEVFEENPVVMIYRLKD